MDGCLCVWMGSPGDDLWLTPAPHLPSGLGQSLMLMNGWPLANRLKGGRLLASGVQSDGLLFVALMMVVLLWSLNVIGLVLISRRRLVGIVRVMHPLRCTRVRGRWSLGWSWCLGDDLEGLRLIMVAVPVGLSR